LDVSPPVGGVWPADVGLPRIDRQAELVPVKAAYTWRHLYERNDDGRNNFRYLTFWQLGLTRNFGRPGLLVAIAASIVLGLVATWAVVRCRRAYDAFTVELSRSSREYA